MSRALVDLKNHLSKLREDKGATAVEYVLIVGGIAAVVGIAIAAFGNEITTWFNNILP
jgi:pilus assembly protein Flp/PilA